MTNLPLAMSRNNISLPLADRVAGGGMIWLLARVVLGGLFLMSGAQKLMGLDGFAGMLAKNGIPESIAPALAAFAAGAETLGGLCIVFGFATSWAALLMIAFTIVAAFIGHRFWEFEGGARMTQMNHFIKNIMIVAGFCFLYVAGGGPYSIDRWRRHHRPEIGS
ncbi:MAG: DoxX family protein [Xanthobacteraceae bacterium]